MRRIAAVGPFSRHSFVGTLADRRGFGFLFTNHMQDIVRVKKAAVLEAVKHEGKDEVHKNAVEGNNLIAKIGQSSHSRSSTHALRRIRLIELFLFSQCEPVWHQTCLPRSD